MSATTNYFAAAKILLQNLWTCPFIAFQMFLLLALLRNDLNSKEEEVADYECKVEKLQAELSQKTDETTSLKDSLLKINERFFMTSLCTCMNFFIFMGSLVKLNIIFNKEQNWMRDKTGDFTVRQNSRFWKRDKIADFDNETKPPIWKWDKTADLL